MSTRPFFDYCRGVNVENGHDETCAGNVLNLKKKKIDFRLKAVKKKDTRTPTNYNTDFAVAQSQ